MKKLLCLFSLLVASAGAVAQSTTVSATVVDSSGQAWTNGTWSVAFQQAPGTNANYYWNGSAFPRTLWSYSGTLSSSGYFSVSLPSNNFINPVGSSWNFTLCSNTSAQCSTIQSVSVTGATLDLSATATATIALPAVAPAPLPRAYSDSEVQVSPTLVGYFYQNSITNMPRYWNGANWSNFGGSVNSVSVGSLNPLFNTTNSGTTNSVATFGFDAAAPNSVFGNCTTTSTFSPTYCSLTLAMLPTGIQASYATTAGTVTGQTTCTGNNFAKSPTSCAQPAFSNLSGQATNAQLTNASTTVNGQTCTLGGSCTISIPVVQAYVATGLCTTPNAAYGTCSNGPYTWPTAFADTNYAVSCTPLGVTSTGSAAVLTVQLTAKTTTTFTFLIQNGDANGANPATATEVDCIGKHN